MSKPRSYIAGPYTSTDPEVQAFRGREHCRLTVNLLKDGLIVYSPIAETMNLVLYGGMKGTDWNTWREKDLVEVDRSDTMIILMLDGWKESKGVRGEVKFAIKKGIPISLYDTEFDLIFDVDYQTLLQELGVETENELND